MRRRQCRREMRQPKKPKEWDVDVLVILRPKLHMRWLPFRLLLPDILTWTNRRRRVVHLGDCVVLPVISMPQARLENWNRTMRSKRRKAYS